MNINFNINFMAYRKLALVASALLILLSIGSLFVKGLNLGIDFTGGTVIEVGYPDSVELAPIRNTLEAQGYANPVVQHFGTAKDVLIRIAPQEGINQAELADEVLRMLAQSSSSGEVEMRRVEFVGPQVGEDLRDDGGLAVLFALFGILVYIALRFEYRFALGSIAALIHDVVITVGFFSLFGIEFDLTVLAAILAVIGYSLNDTIVVFDRIRENFRKLRKATPIEVINGSINQTLARTMVTSLTTLVVLIALFFLGGEIIHSFAMALIVGVIVGTYSSIYVASSLTLMLGISKVDLMPVQKEEADDRP
ncbi:MAG: protein translocase subunit SecF [Gammaproteobacteria bacterium]|nr:protein translocase subunit SecF [Gammaproteobacteria bacterium]